MVTTYEEQVYDSDGVLRGASSSEDEDDTIGDEMMATLMDAAAAMETIQSTSGEPESPVQYITTASEWRGTHTRFDDEDGTEDEVDEMVVGRNKNATVSGKSKGEYCSSTHQDGSLRSLLITAHRDDATGAVVRVSDSPAPAKTRTKATVKVQVEEIDDLASSLGASTIG